jgi:antitoxin (DNA-binding transcriptional repressor) of toxin-antitoxin stability system
MKQVAIRELKDHLSEYLLHVRDGEVVLVTDRGEVVAELPPGTAARLLAEDRGLLEDRREDT